MPCCHGWIVGTQSLLLDRQRALDERLGVVGVEQDRVEGPDPLLPQDLDAAASLALALVALPLRLAFRPRGSRQGGMGGATIEDLVDSVIIDSYENDRPSG